MRRPELLDVPVDGGTLRVGRWPGPPGAPVVLGAHGITANLMSFAALAAELGDAVTLVVPDLRGRGGSRDVGPPYSMAHHADDVAAVLDHEGVASADLLVGHSMGGFVAVVTADRHPDRVARLLLVDGGLPLDLGALAELPVDQLITAVIGPAADRLRMTFESAAAYRDFFRVHPSLADDWSEWVEAYLDYDLVGAPPALVPGCRVEAMEGDTESQLVRDDVPAALERLHHPTLLVRAPRGIMNADPLYGAPWVADWVGRLPSLRTVDVDDVNHYTVLLSSRGAAQVAQAVRAELDVA